MSDKKTKTETKSENKPRILSRFDIAWLYGWDLDNVERLYQLQFKDNNSKKEKDID